MPNAAAFREMAVECQRIATELGKIKTKVDRPAPRKAIQGGRLKVTVDRSFEVSGANMAASIGGMAGLVAECNSRATACANYEAALAAYHNAMGAYHGAVASNNAMAAAKTPSHLIPPLPAVPVAPTPPSYWSAS